MKKYLKVSWKITSWWVKRQVDRLETNVCCYQKQPVSLCICKRVFGRHLNFKWTSTHSSMTSPAPLPPPNAIVTARRGIKSESMRVASHCECRTPRLFVKTPKVFIFFALKIHFWPWGVGARATILSDRRTRWTDRWQPDKAMKFRQTINAHQSRAKKKTLKIKRIVQIYICKSSLHPSH